MWRYHWSHRIDERNAAYLEPGAPVRSGQVECITGESNASSQEGSQGFPMDFPALHPASLYEQVKSLHIICTADDEDSDWTTVPVRRPHVPFKLGNSSDSAQSKHAQEQRLKKWRPPGKRNGQMSNRCIERCDMPRLTHGIDGVIRNVCLAVLLVACKQ